MQEAFVAKTLAIMLGAGLLLAGAAFAQSPDLGKSPRSFPKVEIHKEQSTKIGIGTDDQPEGGKVFPKVERRGPMESATDHEDISPGRTIQPRVQPSPGN